MSSVLPGEDPDRRDELARLPQGRHGLPPEFVAHNQRERLIASFIALVGEGGYGAATISATTAGAGVSSRTFYKYFATVEECCLGAFEKALEWVAPPVAAAFQAEPEWPQAVRAALAAGLAELAGAPDAARLLTVEPFVAGPEVAKRHKAALERMVPYLRQGRELHQGGGADGQAGEPLPETTEKGLLGAVNSLISRQLLAGGGEGLEDLLPDLTQFVLTPYLGAAEARRIATKSLAS